MKKRVVFLIVLSSLFIANTGHATNGYFAHGFGAGDKAMAGAGVALETGAMGGALNPAALVNTGDDREGGLALFVPERGFRANDDADPFTPQIAAGDYVSDNDVFLIPHYGRNRELDEQSSWAMILSANGLNSEYDAAVFQGFVPPGAPDMFNATSPTGVDLYQLLLDVPYSRRLSQRSSVGIGPTFAFQMLRVQGLEPFRALSSSPDHVSGNGFDYSYGAGLMAGWQYQVSDAVSFGLSARSRTWMTPFDEYRGLFAEQGDFDIPASFQAGLGVKLSDAVTVAIDYQEIFYSDVKAVGNRNDMPIAPGSLGTDEGIGGGWQDAEIVKLGIEWKYSDDMVFRAGYSRSNQIIPDTQALLNILAPAVGREHYTIGFTRRYENDRELIVTLMHVPRETVTGSNPNTVGQTGDLEMRQTELMVSFGKRFE